MSTGTAPPPDPLDDWGLPLAGLFVLTLVGGLWFITFVPEWRVNNFYAEGRCLLLDKRVHEDEGLYRPELRIRYRVDGWDYETWAYNAVRSHSIWRWPKERFLARFTVGQEYPCWYDPDDHSRVVVVRGYGSFSYVTSAVLAVIVSLTGWGVFRRIRHARRRAAAARSPYARPPRPAPAPAPVAPAAGPAPAPLPVAVSIDGGALAMTEADWLTCTDAEAMLLSLRGKATERKLRLYSCACCRRVWDRLSRSGRKAVETAERFADGRAGWWGTFAREARLLPEMPRAGHPRQLERSVVHGLVSPWAEWSDGAGVGVACEAARLVGDGRPGPADLVRDIFRYPRPVTLFPRRLATLDPHWRTADVLGLARAIYDDRAFDRMPLLADALMDAGCDNDEVIAHCRSPGPHVRGCWVVDLVLDKE